MSDEKAGNLFVCLFVCLFGARSEDEDVWPTSFKILICLCLPHLARLCAEDLGHDEGDLRIDARVLALEAARGVAQDVAALIIHASRVIKIGIRDLP